MLQGVQDAIKSNDIGALEKASEAANKAGLTADEVVQGGVKHLAFLNEERTLVQELTKVCTGVKVSAHALWRVLSLFVGCADARVYVRLCTARMCVRVCALVYACVFGWVRVCGCTACTRVCVL